MTIHHTLTKKAATNNVMLEDGDERVVARWNENEAVFAFHTEAKEALALCLRFRGVALEYPGLVIAQEPDDQDAFVATLNGQVLAEGDELDDVIAEALEAYQDAGAEQADEEPAEDEPKAGSIVRSKYRAEYKARGTPTHCNDWVAQQFNYYASHSVTTERTVKGKKVRVTKDVADVEAVYAIAAANGVTKQWRNLNPGQQSMNARNMVRAIVVKTGQLVVPASVTNGGGQLTLDADPLWLAAKRASKAKPATE